MANRNPKNEKPEADQAENAKPLNVCIADDSQKDRTGRTYWTRVGVAFKHREGEGFNIIIAPGLAVSGKLIVMAPKDDDQD